MTNHDKQTLLPNKVTIYIKDSRRKLLDWIIDKEIISKLVVAGLIIAGIELIFKWTGL